MNMCVIPGVLGGVLPRDGSAPACPPPKFPLDEPFVPYSLEGRV